MSAQPPARWVERIPDWPPFRRLLAAHALQAAGDALVAVALADTLFFTVPAAEARDRVALYLLVAMAPYAVLSPVVGPMLDRTPAGRRTAVLAAAGGRAVLAVILSGRTAGLLLYPLAFGMLVLSKVHGVGRSAMVPDVLPPGRDPSWGNAWLAVSSVVAGMAAALPGAGIVRLAGPRWCLLPAAVLFGVSLVAAARTPGVNAGVATPARALRLRVPLHPRLVAGAVATAAARTAVGFLLFFLAFALRAEGVRGAGFALVLAAAGVGSVGGAALAPRLRRAAEGPVLTILALAGVGASGLWAAGDLTVFRAGVLAAATGLGASVARLAFDAMVQTEIPADARARTFARTETLFQACWVGGAGFATAVPLGGETGARFLAVVCFAGILVSAGRLAGVRAAAEPRPPQSERD